MKWRVEPRIDAPATDTALDRAGAHITDQLNRLIDSTGHHVGDPIRPADYRHCPTCRQELPADQRRW